MPRDIKNYPELFPCGDHESTPRSPIFDLEFLVDEDTKFTTILSGTNLVLSGTDGSFQSTSLSSFIDIDTDTKYAFLKKGDPVPLDHTFGEGNSTVVLGGNNVVATGLTIGAGGITGGFITINGETVSVTGLGDSFTDSQGTVITVKAFPDTDSVTIEVLTELKNTITLSSSNGDEQFIDLFECLSSVFLDNTNKCYDLSLSGYDLSLSSNQGDVTTLTLPDSNTTYDQILSGSNLILSSSDGQTVTNDLSIFFDDTDTDTTYEFGIDGTNLVLSGSDGYESIVALSSFLDDTDTTVTYTQFLSGANNDTLYLSGSDGSLEDTDLSSLLDDTNTTYDFSLSGTNWVASGSDGSESVLPLDTLFTGANTTYTLLKNQPSVTTSGTLDQGTYTLTVGGQTISVVGLDVGFVAGPITAGTISLNGEITSLVNVGDTFTDSNGVEIILTDFPNDDQANIEIITPIENSLALSGSDGSLELFNLFECLSATYPEPKCYELVLSSNVLTLSSDIGVSSEVILPVDQNTQYIPILSGTDFVLSGSDGSEEVIPLSSFLDDTDTNVTYTQFLSGTDNAYLYLSGSDGSLTETNLSAFLDDTDTNVTYTQFLSGTDFVLSGSDGSEKITTLSSFLDDTTVTYDYNLIGTNWVASGSDGTTQSIPLSSFLDDTDTTVTYTQFLSGANNDTLYLSGSDGSIGETNLSSFLDNTDTNVTYDYSLSGTNWVASGSDGNTQIVDMSSFLDDTNTEYVLSAGTNQFALSSSTGQVSIINQFEGVFTDIAALQACVFNSTLITFTPPTTNYEIRVDYEGFPSGFGYLLENGDATSEFTIPLGPNGEAIVSYTVVSPAAGTFTETPTCVPVEGGEDDTFVTLTDEGNGTASTKNADGTDGPCLLTCAPDGTPAGYVPKVGSNGSIVWGPDIDTTYTYTAGGTLTDSDGNTQDLSDLISDPDVKVSGFSVSGSNYLITMSDGSTFTVPITDVTITGNTAVITDAQGDPVTIDLTDTITPDSLNDNNDGTYTGTGDIDSVDTRVSAVKAVDPAEACSDRVTVTSPNNTPQNIDGVGRTNTYSEQSVPSNTTGTYVAHDIRGENDGTALDTETEEVAQKVLQVETKAACKRTTTTYVEGFVRNTLYVDQYFGDDSTGRRQRSDKPFKSMAGARAASQDGDTIVLRPDIYIDSIIAQDGRTYIAEGVTLQPTGNSSATFNAYAIRAQNGVERFSIHGRPDIIGANNGQEGAGLIFRNGLNNVHLELGVIDVGGTGWHDAVGGGVTGSTNNDKHVLMDFISVDAGRANGAFQRNAIIINKAIGTTSEDVTLNVKSHIRDHSTTIGVQQYSGVALLIGAYSGQGGNYKVRCPLIESLNGVGLAFAPGEGMHIEIIDAHIRAKGTFHPKNSVAIGQASISNSGPNNRLILRNCSVETVDSTGNTDFSNTVNVLGGVIQPVNIIALDDLDTKNAGLTSGYNFIVNGIKPNINLSY